MSKSEIQEKLKKIRDSRREFEVLRERHETYSKLYGDNGKEARELKKELSDKRRALINQIHDAQDMIDKLQDISERSTLSLYYIDCLPMAVVAERLFYTERSVWGKHRTALMNLARISKENS